MGLPITTTTAGQWLNSLIFHDNLKGTTANGQMTIYMGADYMSCDDFSFHAKNLGSAKSFLIYTYCYGSII